MNLIPNANVSHNVVQVDWINSTRLVPGGFNSGRPGSLRQFSVRFNQMGYYYFICQPHASTMMGTIMVSNGTEIEND